MAERTSEMGTTLHLLMEGLEIEFRRALTKCATSAS
jgi:hypothetical protein